MEWYVVGSFEEDSHKIMQIGIWSLEWYVVGSFEVDSREVRQVDKDAIYGIFLCEIRHRQLAARFFCTNSVHRFPTLERAVRKLSDFPKWIGQTKKSADFKHTVPKSGPVLS